jgi:hypothetical protein
MLELVTLLLAAATVYLAYQTHRLAAHAALSERTRISIDQNWRLWQHREQLWVPVAPEALKEEEWRWRLPLLNHFNLLLLSYRHAMFGLGRLTGRHALREEAAKSKAALPIARNDSTGVAQLKQLLKYREGFPSAFVEWMESEEIILPSDLQ